MYSSTYISVISYQNHWFIAVRYSTLYRIWRTGKHISSSYHHTERRWFPILVFYFLCLLRYSPFDYSGTHRSDNASYESAAMLDPVLYTYSPPGKMTGVLLNVWRWPLKHIYSQMQPYCLYFRNDGNSTAAHFQAWYWCSTCYYKRNRNAYLQQRYTRIMIV